MAEALEIETELLAFLQREIFAPETTLTPETDLIEAGFDSMSLVRVLLFVETHYGFWMPEGEINAPAPDDVFFVPLDQILAWQTLAWTAAGPPIPAVRRLAQAGRAARERQRAWAMPLAFAAGAPAGDEITPHPGPDAWHVRGTGGRARGVVVAWPISATSPRAMTRASSTRSWSRPR